MTQSPTPDQPLHDRRTIGFAPGVRLGSLFGIEIRADWSLLIVFGLILVDLAVGLFPRWHPEWPVAFAWLVAFAAATLFFLSILLHELAHAVVGRSQGIPIHAITLFLFGGMAHMEGEPPSPKSEFLMAVVGPITSLLIGIGATVLGIALAGGIWVPAGAFDHPELLLARFGALPTLLLWLGPINVLLAVFNIVPGFPLDGGRVLRSVLWASTGDLAKATRWASGAGRVFGWLLMALGVVNAFGGAFLQGMWLLLIGWFLSNAARMSYTQLLVRKALEHVSVADVMRRNVVKVDPDTTVETVVNEVLLVSDQDCVPVVDPSGTLMGLVRLSDVRGVPRERWESVPVRQVMRVARDTMALAPDADAQSALDALAQRNIDQLPVVLEHKVLGLVSGRDLLRRLSLHDLDTHGAHAK